MPTVPGAADQAVAMMVPAGPRPQRSTRRRAATVVFCVSALLYCVSPNVTNYDSFLSFPTAVSIVHSGDLTLDEFQSPTVARNDGNVELAGHHVDWFPWVVSLIFVPAVAVIDAAANVGVGHGSMALVENGETWPVQLLMASLVTALAAALVTMLAFDRSRSAGRRRVVVSVTVGLTFALATSSWSTASRALWQHGPSMVLIAAAFLVAGRAMQQSRPAWFIALGSVVAGAYTVRPTNALVVAVFAMWCLTRGLRWFFWFCGGGLVVGLVWSTINWWTFGTVLPPYFQSSRLGLSSTYAEALLANLISPARGLLVFAPVTLVAVAGVLISVRRRELDSLGIVAMVGVVGYLLVVSSGREAWWAGDSIGPRFMCDPLPMLALLAVPAVDTLVTFRGNAATIRQRVAVILVVASLMWSIVVNGGAAMMRQTNCWNTQPESISADPHRVWSWRRPQVLEGYITLFEDGLRAAVLGTCGATPTDASPPTAQRVG